VPAIVSMTPYISDTLHPRGAYFATHGLCFVAVDVRGRSSSQGEFRPFIQEARDGYDIIEWVARQPWCNGRVGMWGGSYLGYAQWATAKERPPHLATIVPTAAPCLGVDFPMRNNIFYPYLVQWLFFTSGRVSQLKAFTDEDFWSTLYLEWHESGGAFGDLDLMLGGRSPVYQEWISHPEPDAYWAAHNPTPEQYAALTLPVLTITGSYDDDQPGALEHYRRYMRYASAEARARHYLVIGPWDHAGTATPAREFGGVTIGEAGVVDLPKLHREWYAWTLEGGPKPDLLRKPVAYYVMGAERWCHADTLEAITAGYRTLFLDSACNANDLFRAGSLGTEPGVGQPDGYRYDPRDTRGPEVAAEAQADGNSLVDQTVLSALCGKSLVYHSSPFDEVTEISGFFRLSVWLAIDCPDTDIYVSVHEIAPDGTSIRLSTDALRARYREGLTTPKPVVPGEPLQYDFDRFTFVSREIRKGHRLRLVIAPMGRIIGATFAQKNYNAGGVVAYESVEKARPVTVRLLHDTAHPSALYVPLGAEAA
jgi:putative CocE/NonD family hydrolase